MKIHKIKMVLLAELQGHEYSSESLVFDHISCGDANHTLVWPEALIRVLEAELASPTDILYGSLATWQRQLLASLREVPKHTYVSFGC